MRPLWRKVAFPTKIRRCEVTFTLSGEIPQVSGKKGQKPLDLYAPIVYNNDRSDHQLTEGKYPGYWKHGGRKALRKNRGG